VGRLIRFKFARGILPIFFLVGLGLELQVLPLDPHLQFILLCLFGKRISQTVCPSELKPYSTNLSLQVAIITEVGLQCPAQGEFLNIYKYYLNPYATE
jgi:hypothetical protein